MYITEKYLCEKNSELYLNEGIFKEDVRDIECRVFKMGHGGEHWRFYSPFGDKELGLTMFEPENLQHINGESDGHFRFIRTVTYQENDPIDTFIFDGSFKRFTGSVTLNNIRNSNKFPDGSSIEINNNRLQKLGKIFGGAFAIGQGSGLGLELLINKLGINSDAMLIFAMFLIAGVTLASISILNKYTEKLKLTFKRIS